MVPVISFTFSQSSLHICFFKMKVRRPSVPASAVHSCYSGGTWETVSWWVQVCYNRPTGLSVLSIFSHFMHDNLQRSQLLSLCQRCWCITLSFVKYWDCCCASRGVKTSLNLLCLQYITWHWLIWCYHCLLKLLISLDPVSLPCRNNCQILNQLLLASYALCMERGYQVSNNV